MINEVEFGFRKNIKRGRRDFQSGEQMRSYNSFTAVAALRTDLGAKEDEENVFVTRLEFGDNHREFVFFCLTIEDNESHGY